MEAAEAAGVPLTGHQNRRWDADVLTLAQVLASSALGELVMLESTMEQAPPGPGFSTETGGGVLLDFGSHVVDQVLTLLGPATSVHTTWRQLPGTSFDDRFTATVTHAGGVVSVVTANWALHGAPARRFRALGTDGTYAVPACDVVADQLLAGIAGTDPDLGVVPQECWGTLWRKGCGEAVPSLRGDWCAFYTGFARAVRGEAPVPVDPWQSVAALELLDAARRSATTARSSIWPDRTWPAKPGPVSRTGPGAPARRSSGPAGPAPGSTTSHRPPRRSAST